MTHLGVSQQDATVSRTANRKLKNKSEKRRSMNITMLCNCPLLELEYSCPKRDVLSHTQRNGRKPTVRLTPLDSKFSSRLPHDICAAASLRRSPGRRGLDAGCGDGHGDGWVWLSELSGSMKRTKIDTMLKDKRI
jgi:hypothetical protein